MRPLDQPPLSRARIAPRARPPSLPDASASARKHSCVVRARRDTPLGARRAGRTQSRRPIEHTRTDTSAPPSDRMRDAYTHARSALVAMVVGWLVLVSRSLTFRAAGKAKRLREAG